MESEEQAALREELEWAAVSQTHIALRNTLNKSPLSHNETYMNREDSPKYVQTFLFKRKFLLKDGSAGRTT
jgi:hypothetical protein